MFSFRYFVSYSIQVTFFPCSFFHSPCKVLLFFLLCLFLSLSIFILFFSIHSTVFFASSLFFRCRFYLLYYFHPHRFLAIFLYMILFSPSSVFFFLFLIPLLLFLSDFLRIFLLPYFPLPVYLSPSLSFSLNFSVLFSTSIDSSLYNVFSHPFIFFLSISLIFIPFICSFPSPSVFHAVPSLSRHPAFFFLIFFFFFSLLPISSFSFLLEPSKEEE